MSNETEYLKEIAHNTSTLNGSDNTTIDFTATNNLVSSVRSCLPNTGVATENTSAQIALLCESLNDAIALLAKLTDTQPISASSLPLPSGAASSALQELQIVQIESSNTINIIPNIRTTALSTSNREYNESFSNVRLIEIFCRNLIEIRYAFNTGDIAANKYRSIPAGASQAINFPTGYRWSGILYLASSVDNAIVEIESWQ